MIPGRYYDGRTARGHDARLRPDGPVLRIDTPAGEVLARWPLDGVETVGSWEGRGPFALGCRSAPEARVLLSDLRGAQALRALLPQLAAAERVRNRRGLKLGVIGALAAALLLVLVYEGLPRWLASSIPAAWLAPLGATIVAMLEEEHGTCGDSWGRWTLERVANRLAVTAGYQGWIRVDILNWHELNAFALPGDRIVVLRGVIDEASPDELAGVLAHEVGHVVHRHVNEGVVRALGVQVALTLFTGTGDLASSAAATLATLGYSRAAEAEADRFAVEAMRAEALRVSGLRRFFQRLVKTERAALPSWLSTHPATADRIAALPDDNAGVDAFTKTEWVAIRSTCR